MTKNCGVLAAVVLLALTLLTVPTTDAGERRDANTTAIRGAEVIGPIPAVLTPPMSSLAQSAPWQPGDPIKEVPRGFGDGGGERQTKEPHAGNLDPLIELQRQATESGRAPTFIEDVNIAGHAYSGATPPDTVGDVGPDHYVQAVNASRISIYDKDGTLLPGYPISLEDLAPGGDACNTNAGGDPIVLYDHLADRWFLSEFTGGTAELCLYVSQTPDPTGAYYFYRVAPRPSHDYPHYGVWPDAYYLSINRNSEVNALALNRNEMLVGGSLSVQYFSTLPELPAYNFEAITPVNADGATPPPVGAPGIFMRHYDDEAHSGSPDAAWDSLEMWEYAVDWTTPANSTITYLTPVPITDYNSWLVDYTTFYSIPQPGTSTRLDPIRECILNILVHRNFGGYESLVGNFITNQDPATTGDTVDGGTRWFELRSYGGGPWGLHQEGTFGPGTAGTHHFMGASAMDGKGNIALGYAKTDTDLTIYPSIGYTGRLEGDPLGTMGSENDAILGGASQTGTGRYGDYAAMSVDPVDDCTFWMTNEYIPAGGSWATQIVAFHFEECAYGFTLTPSPAVHDVCALTDPDPTYDFEVKGTAGWTGTVDLSDNGTNPAGTTSSLVPPSGAVTFTSTYTISNLMGAATGNYVMEITGTAGTITRSSQVALNLAVDNPSTPALSAPADAANGVSLKPNFTWGATLNAMSYSLDVATDAAFSNIVYTASGITGTSHLPGTALDPSTLYFWRVTAHNLCGTATSTAYSFTTVILVCDTYVSTDVPQTIPTSGSVSSTLEVLMIDGGIIADVNVLNLEGTHTYMGDVDFNIVSPLGTSVMIMDRRCGTDENFDIDLDDEAASGDWPCPPTDGLAYQPFQSLHTFDLEDSTGIWTLTINDNVGGDGGQLNNWSLEICVESPTDFFVDAAPLTQAACQPDEPQYMVNVGGTGPVVTLGASGHPAGTTPVFSPGSVSPPGTATLTITNTSGATTGHFDIDISGDNGTGVDTFPVGLDLYDAAPGAPTLIGPADGAVDVSLAPTFSWTAAAGAGAYTVTVSSDPGFGTVVYEVGGITETNHITGMPLDTLTPYYWHVAASNPCGSTMSTDFSFTTAEIPPILLVDDDDNSPDVLSYYDTALTNLGLTYDYWDTGYSDVNEPTATDLAPYGVVIWFSGDSWQNDTAGPGADGEAALSTWLDSDRCLLISAQDYFYNKGLTTFMQTYLGASDVDSDVAQTVVTGAGSAYGGYGPYTLNYPTSNYSDDITPGASAEVAFTGTTGNAAINRTANYKTTFMGFPAEALAGTDMDEVLGAFIASCQASGSGTVDGTVLYTPVVTDQSGTLVEAYETVGSTLVDSTTTDASGAYSLSLAAANYDIYVSRLNFLWGVYNVEVTDGSADTLPDVALLGGDFVVDASEEVTVVDVTYVASRYGTGDLSADLNGSGDVDLVDITATASHYGQTSPVPWP